jgi:class 3 adenylate cyclase
MAELIPGARFVALAGADHLVFIGADAVLDEAVAFLGGPVTARRPERILTTVLHVDVVDSTATAARLGDDVWRDRVSDVQQRVATGVADHDGVLVTATGDGALAHFDGPARAVRAGRDILAALEPLGLAVRAGVHTAEVERAGTDLVGIGVHIGGRVAAAAEPGEVWTTRTVRDLVVGSGLTFDERGIHQLPGVPETWPLYAVS